MYGRLTVVVPVTAIERGYVARDIAAVALYLVHGDDVVYIRGSTIRLPIDIQFFIKVRS